MRPADSFPLRVAARLPALRAGGPLAGEACRARVETVPPEPAPHPVRPPIRRSQVKKVGQDITLGLVSFTHSAYGDFLRWILSAYGLETRRRTQAERYEHYTRFLVDEYSKGRRVVLVIDETQNLSPGALEQLKLLSNVNVEGHELLQIIMSGQTNLRAKLLQPGFEQLVQRIAFSYHLEPFDRRESEQYIRYRLSVAGASDTMNLFSSDACELVYHKSSGVPRVINVICDCALVYGYAAQKHIMDAEVIDDRERTGIPFLPRFAEAPANSGPRHRARPAVAEPQAAAGGE
jgi:hypothetical protein